MHQKGAAEEEATTKSPQEWQQNRTKKTNPTSAQPDLSRKQRKSNSCTMQPDLLLLCVFDIRRPKEELCTVGEEDPQRPSCRIAKSE